MKLRRSICLSFLTEAPVPCVRSAIAFAALGLLATGAMAQNVWTRSGTNDWYGDVTNWSQGHFPQAGEAVVITNASVGVMLTNVAPVSGWLSSFVISNTATLIFSNWDTTLSATTVNIMTNGRITCSGPFTNNAMSNRVYVVCSNMTIATGGQINVDRTGYSGSTGGDGHGPGGGKGQNGGAYGGFGGRGGTLSVECSYPVGDPQAPLLPGSGGGRNAPGGHGGGAVRIAATGKVIVNGTITANGGPDSGTGGGGSGGGIYITCNTLYGTSGVVRANGSAGQPWAANGAGGRIAVSYYPPAQSNEPPASIQFSVLPSLQWQNFTLVQADIGTVYFPDASLLTEPINVSGQILIDASSWNPGSLTISNKWVRFTQDGFRLTVTNDVRIIKGADVGRLDIGGSVLTNFHPVVSLSWAGYRFFAGVPHVLDVGGSLILTNAALLYVYSAPTNGSGTNYGSLVNVAGDVTIGTGCWVYAYSHWSNGGSPLFRMRSLTISSNAGFNANAAGWAAGEVGTHVGYGPGGGAIAQSGSYGGLAGGAASGKTYGSSNAPVDPGSGGYSGGYLGGFGGGLVRVEAAKTITFDGTITANGGDLEEHWTGGGSGGGVYLRCHTFAGSTSGIIRANGGYGSQSGGGGGRIALWRVLDASTGTISNSVAAGSAYSGTAGSNGTIVFGWLPPPGTVFRILGH